MTEPGAAEQRAEAARQRGPEPNARSRPSPNGEVDAEPRSEAPPASKETNRGPGSFLRELPILVLVAFALAFLLRTFIVQVFYIPSSSMEPTLQVNDRILVDKVSYRFRDLSRGEVVVFEGDRLVGLTPPQDGATETILRGLGQLIGIAPANARDFVKRVIGLPGDEVRIDETGTVFVNGVALPEPYIGQTDPRGCGPLVVPEGQLFFLGDNRGNSSDSRASLGFVPREHVVGRAFLTLWPPERVHLLDRPAYPAIPEPTSDVPPAPDAPRGSVC
ncbi:MAG: signal peptidase I [Nitriliruptorales bacterium]